MSESENSGGSATRCESHCSSSVIVGVNDQKQWNASIREMQKDLEWKPLIDFLERLKEPENAVG